MPSHVLTTASTILCGHAPGTLKFLPPAQTKLKVGAGFALVKADLMAAKVAGCPMAPPTNVTCLTVAAVVAGTALKLRVNGQPVMLAESLAGTTSGSAGPTPGPLTVTVVQMKLTAS